MLWGTQEGVGDVCWVISLVRPCKDLCTWLPWPAQQSLGHRSPPSAWVRKLRLS